ncbi:hypothetical protein KEM52_005972 [Ascosphaera acerosa]|nr:hypothetical protein KEM52_005972 [Ascosphaera acerosa]
MPDLREQQVELLRRLIFNQQHVLLITSMGFGKSVYSILTGRTSLVIVPLVKLGDEQVAAINRVPGVRACLVSAATKYENPDLLDEIKQRRYSHVVMGPEQAMAPEMKAVLRSPDCSATIGLFAIDEIHLLLDWRLFRTDYVLLQQPRHILPPQVVWFGCTATLTAEAEASVRQMAGFREEGEGVQHPQ